VDAGVSPLLASKGVTDPAAWGHAFGSIGAASVFASETTADNVIRAADVLDRLGAGALVFLTAMAFIVAFLVVWRGVPRFNIVGAGAEFQRMTKAQERHTRDQRVIITWLAHAFGREPPTFDDDPEAVKPSTPPPPMPPVPAHAAARGADAPASRRAGRGPQPSRPR